MMKAIRITAISLIALTIATVVFLRQPSFGANPSGKRLERIMKSPNYKNGSFQNEHETPVKPDSASYWTMMADFLFRKDKRNTPAGTIPSVRTDLLNYTKPEPRIVWFGHSSYLITSNSFNILVDPVFSGYASPVSFIGKSFKGSDAYTVSDMPPIDACIITHDHYDHLDYNTIRELNSKVKHFYTALGVGAHLEAWGIGSSKITELDWWEAVPFARDGKITAAPARHFSGRGLVRNKSLWASYVLELHGIRIYVGGDSGYDTHFKRIGETFGAFDIVMLECGQYGKDWPLIHMTPEETAQAAADLNTKVLLPVHWAKFSLALHAWNEPIERLLKAPKGTSFVITTPMIGEPLLLGSVLPGSRWWQN